MVRKKVTKAYAKNEFKLIGLVLILYSLFVLYVPYLFEELFALYNITTYKSIDLLLAAKSFIVVIGTIVPFLFLRIADKRYKKEKVIVSVNFLEIVKQSMVFFTFLSAVIFATTAVLSSFNIPGTLVSAIGFSLNNVYLNNWQYALVLIVVTPILEEFAFRGVLLKVLSKYGKYFALMTSALIFALAHGSFKEIVPCFVMGVLLGKLTLRYRSIKPTILIHMAFNGILFILINIPEKYSLYSSIVMAIVYIVSIVFVLLKKYHHIIVKKAQNSLQVIKMFFNSFSVIIVLVLYIVRCILSIL